MCDGSASDAFRVMKELHQLLIAEKLYDDAKEYWTKVFNKHGEKSSWEGMLHPKLVIMRCRHYRQGDFCCALSCDIGCSEFFFSLSLCSFCYYCCAIIDRYRVRRN